MKTDADISLIESEKDNSGGLISMLEAIQARYGYLPEEDIKAVSQETGRPLADIYGVVAYHHHFSLQPRGKHLVYCCLGPDCHSRSSLAIAREIARQLAIAPGDSTADHQFTFDTVKCRGACANGPIVVIDGRYFSNVEIFQIRDILDTVRTENNIGSECSADDNIIPLDVCCPHCSHSLMDESHRLDGFPSICVTAAHGALHGWLRLSAVQSGSIATQDLIIPRDTVTQFICPHCNSALEGRSSCTDCGAPMMNLESSRGGIVQICSRRGCRGLLQSSFSI